MSFFGFGGGSSPEERALRKLRGQATLIILEAMGRANVDGERIDLPDGTSAFVRGSANRDYADARVTGPDTETIDMKQFGARSDAHPDYPEDLPFMPHAAALIVASAVSRTTSWSPVADPAAVEEQLVSDLTELGWQVVSSMAGFAMIPAIVSLRKGDRNAAVSSTHDSVVLIESEPASQPLDSSART